jgi:hypothetical protein
MASTLSRTLVDEGATLTMPGAFASVDLRMAPNRLRVGMLSEYREAPLPNDALSL